MKTSALRLLLLLVPLTILTLCPSETLAQGQNLEITIKRGSEVKTLSNQPSFAAAINNSGFTKAQITEIEVTAGTFSTNDWREFESSSFKAIKRFVILDGVTVEDTPDYTDTNRKDKNGVIYADCPLLPDWLNNDQGTVSLINGIQNSSAYFSNTPIEEFIVPGLKKLPNQIFQNCSTIKTVILPDVEQLGGIYPKLPILSSNSQNGSCFTNCSSLVYIYVPKVKYVGRMCFGGCMNLKQISLPSAKIIGYGAFTMAGRTGTAALEYVYAPNVDTIGLHAFQQCRNLSELWLGEKPPVVMSYNWAANGNADGGRLGCPEVITESFGPDPLTNGDSYLCNSVALTWAGISNLLIVPSDTSLMKLANGKDTIIINALQGSALNASITEYYADTTDDKGCMPYENLWFGGMVGERTQLVVSINNKAQQTVNSLQEALESPDGVGSVTNYNQVKKIEVFGGVLYYNDWNHMREYRSSFTNLDTIIIHPPQNLPDIKQPGNVGTLTYNQNELYLPNSLKVFIGYKTKIVGACAFNGLSNLHHVELPECNQIGENAFYNCSSLKKIKLPKLEKIIQHAFQGSGLDSIWLPPTPPMLHTKNYRSGALTLQSTSTNDNPFTGLKKPRFMRFVNSSSGEELPAGSKDFKTAKQAYKAHSYYNSTNKTWLGWTFFDEHTLTINVTNGSVAQKSAALEGVVGASTYTHSAMDSLAQVSLLPLEKAVVYISDTLELRPASGYALHPTRSINISPTLAVTNGTFAMPGKQDVAVALKFEPLFHIDGNPSTPAVLDTLIEAGGRVCPVDSIFGGDLIDIGDIVKPAEDYEACSISVKNGAADLDASYIIRDASGNIAQIKMPEGGADIRVEVSFCSKYTVEVVYGENHGSGVTNTTYRLLPSKTLTIPTDAASCYEKDTITVKRASDASDITLQVLGGAKYDVVTMPASPVNMVVDVSYRKQVVTLTYDVNDAAYGSINGNTTQTIECGGDGDEVEAVPSDPEKYRLASWSDGTDIASAKHRATSVNSPITITANFEPIYYTVTVNTAAGGAASANKLIELFKGDNVTLTLTPDAGYGLKDLTVEDANGNAVPHTP
ncbi:MAG: leucine-rich repeat protein, partial [Bacteroidales bacterium]|nr:leucine-rich repeat protein [Bacteroidales bacterium]